MFLLAILMILLYYYMELNIGNFKRNAKMEERDTKRSERERATRIKFWRRIKKTG